MSDLLRLAVERFGKGIDEPLARLLAVVDQGLRDGDEGVINAVAMSFVEDAAWWGPANEAFIATWSDDLAAEVVRRRAAPSS